MKPKGCVQRQVAQPLGSTYWHKAMTSGSVDGAVFVYKTRSEVQSRAVCKT